MSQGLFITFEGIEGCGKSTQIDLLEKYLVEQGHTVTRTREPGGTWMGERIRTFLLAPDEKEKEMTPEAEVYLFAAARAQILREVIWPALERGEVVLCDRFVDSSLAYQGEGRGLGIEAVSWANRIATDGKRPRRVYLLDIPVDVSRERAAARGSLDRFEQLEESFHQRVRDGFLLLHSRNTHVVKHIDGMQSVEDIAAEIQEDVLGLL